MTTQTHHTTIRRCKILTEDGVIWLEGPDGDQVSYEAAMAGDLPEWIGLKTWDLVDQWIWNSDLLD